MASPRTWPRLPGVRIPFGLRVFFRGAFVLLALATLALALSVLQEEKQLSWRNYQTGFAKTQAQIAARLRHPTGQLALINPAARSGAATPVRPLVLPFGAIDFDDRAKAQQAVEMAGCLVQYPAVPPAAEASLCVAVGSNPLAGGFLYTAGTFASGELVPRRVGELDLGTAHRVRVTVTMRGQTWRWLAPFEASGDSVVAVRGRLTGFVEEADGRTADRPVRDFRGWLWQDGRCLDAGQTGSGCERRSFYSLRLPVALFRDDLQVPREQLVWPPADLDRVLVRVEVLAPGSDAPPLFDSHRPGATPPFSLADLHSLLLPGETLTVRKAGAPAGTPAVATLTGVEDHSLPTPVLLDRLIRRLPVDGYDQPLEARDSIVTPLGRYELTLTGDVRTVNRALGQVAARVGWFVGAMLAAVGLTWAAIELRVIRRITLLTRRAAAVSHSVKGQPGGAITLEVTDLRGRDELGLLAGTLADLMQRVNDDVRREHIRAEQEKDQWHAVGHEIMSPLQSLMALHPGVDDPSHRYIQRMQQAVRVLYGQASPTEAFQAATLPVQALDLDEFLRHVAENAPHAGIADVRYAGAGVPVMIKGDDYALEDVVTHVLRNADRHRLPGSAVQIGLTFTEAHAVVTLHNSGPGIPPALIERIFEYGVSDVAEGDADPATHRGQGLFVARTYMAKMGGTIQARNEPDGVTFVLTLLRA